MEKDLLPHGLAAKAHHRARPQIDSCCRRSTSEGCEQKHSDDPNAGNANALAARA